jgi:cell division septal protein FtsQ
MIVDSPRIFGRKGKFFTLKSKVLKRRKKSSRQRMTNSPLIVVVVLVLIPAAFFGGRYLVNVLLIESRFMVKKILVEGNRFVPSEMILKAAEVRKEDNLFAIDIYEAKRRIEAIPQISSAGISRRLPDTVVIKVDERRVRAAIRSGESGIAACVDSEGVMLPAWGSNGLTDVIYIDGVELHSAKPGGLCNNKHVMAALDVIRLYECSKLEEQVILDTISVDKDGQIHLSAREKDAPQQRLFTIHLGKKDYPQRMAYLIKILECEIKPAARHNLDINLTYDRPVSSSAGIGRGS